MCLQIKYNTLPVLRYCCYKRQSNNMGLHKAIWKSFRYNQNIIINQSQFITLCNFLNEILFNTTPARPAASHFLFLITHPSTTHFSPRIGSQPRIASLKRQTIQFYDALFAFHGKIGRPNSTKICVNLAVIPRSYIGLLPFGFFHRIMVFFQ